MFNRRILLAAVACLSLAAPAGASPRLLVVSTGEAALKVFDGVTYAPLFTVKVAGKPHEVATTHDGRFAILADYEGLDNRVFFIDLDRQEMVDAVNMKPSYKPHGIAITPDDSRLYITCEASRAVCEMDLASRKVVRTIKTRDNMAHLLAISPDGKHLYATAPGNGTIAFIDTDTGEMVRSVLSGLGCEGIAVSRDGREIWTVNRILQTLAVTQADSSRRDTTMSAVGNPIRIRFALDGKTALVSCALQNEIALFDIPSRKETGRIKVGEFPLGIEVCPDGKRWFVTNQQGGSVSVIDVKTKAQTHKFPVGDTPEGIVYLE